MAESQPDRAAGALSTVEKPFRFSDLPRELRNAIYPLFRGSHEPFGRQSFSYWEFHLTGPYLPVLRRLSKKFKAEYDEEIPAFLTLHMNTGSAIPKTSHFDVVERSMPRALFLSLRQLTFQLKAQTITAWQRLDYFLDMNIAAPLQNFQALQSLTFIVKSTLGSLERAIEEADYDPVIFLTNPSPVPSDSSNPDQREVKVAKSLRLMNICYYPMWWELPATAKYQYAFSEDGTKDADINSWPQNRIVYEATASEHESSWYGLDLATFSNG
ncbi:hypothetical protein KC349_g8447 [Hortaea werneckii]|nr:hypothetical protein KC349_g8447 [Hortaea werneckii]